MCWLHFYKFHLRPSAPGPDFLKKTLNINFLYHSISYICLCSQSSATIFGEFCSWVSEYAHKKFENIWCNILGFIPKTWKNLFLNNFLKNHRRKTCKKWNVCIYFALRIERKKKQNWLIPLLKKLISNIMI